MNVNVFQTFQFGLITKKGEIIHIKFSLLLPRKRSGFKWKGTQLIQIGESKMADGSSIVKGHWCFSQLLDFTRQLTIKVIYRFMDSLREIWNLPTKKYGVKLLSNYISAHLLILLLLLLLLLLWLLDYHYLLSFVIVIVIVILFFIIFIFYTILYLFYFIVFILFVYSLFVIKYKNNNVKFILLVNKLIVEQINN